MYLPGKTNGEKLLHSTKHLILIGILSRITQNPTTQEKIQKENIYVQACLSEKCTTFMKINARNMGESHADLRFIETFFAMNTTCPSTSPRRTNACCVMYIMKRN